MRIILEGPDGVGKTTLAQQLADHYGCDIIHMTEKGSKKFFDYQDKARLDNIVSDRSFFSERVYSSVFNRKEKNLTPGEVDELYYWYKRWGWKIIFLDASTETIVKRLNIRGDEDEHKIRNIEKLRATYNVVASDYNIPIIDVEKRSLQEIIKVLEEMK